MSRIFALAQITYKEGIRNRSLFGIVLLSLFIMGLNVAVAGFFMREVGKVTVDMNLSALSFSGSLLVFFVGLNLMAKDIDRKTIQLVLSKPISRAEYIWGKYFGILVFVLISLLALLALSCGTVFLVRQLYPAYFGNFSWAIFFTACFFIYVKLAVLSAIVVFFGSITTSSFVTLILSISVYVVGETLEDVIFYLKTSVTAEQISDSLRRFIDIVSYLFPNFTAFDFKIEAAHGLAIPLARVELSLGYAAGYVVVLLMLASLIFQRREFN